MATAGPERSRRVTAVLREEERVTPLELFFDLVFVLALTQCTALMAANPTWEGLGQGLVVLGLMWWAWTGYAWLTSVVEPEEGTVRIVIFAAMAGLLVVALCIPGAFGDEALLFAGAYAVVRYGQLALFMVASRDEPEPAMLGGTAMYLLAHVAFRWRNIHTLNKQRLLCAVLLVALLPLALEVPSLVLLGILAAVLSALILYETRRFAEPRARIRQELAHQPASD